MTSTQNVPISEILRGKTSSAATAGESAPGEEDDEPKKKSREDWRKAKELEEARKAGTAPAAVDESGKDINPHIPQYISSAPWYFGSKGPTLKHQRPQPEKHKEFSSLDEWYKRGVDTSKKVTKYVKGACENCGSLTHQKKDCMERPRKVGAKYTGKNLAPAEFIQPNLSLDFDGKRDRWAGYDPSEHKAIVEEYQKIEDAKRELRAEKLNGAIDVIEELDEEEDEDKYVDDFDMPGTKVDSKQRITVRNLRIREDTAKYLRNLDLSSAYYDPKTRSMRDNPNPNENENDSDAAYAGENFVRFSGDTTRHAAAQLFAWDAYEKGVDVHLLAEPTKLETLQKVYEKKKEEFKSEVHDSVLKKYGGEKHLHVPPKSLLLAQTEEYVEYSRYGKIVRGEEKPLIRSKYEEDIYLGNHTSVWGSYWHNGHWGYKCCCSFIKNSYCTGESGKGEMMKTVPIVPVTVSTAATTAADVSSEDEAMSSHDDKSQHSIPEEIEDKKKNKRKKEKKKLKRELKKLLRKERKAKETKEMTYEEKLKVALEKEDRDKAKAEEILKMDERKRPYNSRYEIKKPTEEEIEAYQMKRKRDEDPMANFV